MRSKYMHTGQLIDEAPPSFLMRSDFTSDSQIVLGNEYKSIYLLFSTCLFNFSVASKTPYRLIDLFFSVSVLTYFNHTLFAPNGGGKSHVYLIKWKKTMGTTFYFPQNSIEKLFDGEMSMGLSVAEPASPHMFMMILYSSMKIIIK